MIEIKTWHKPDLGTFENVSKSNIWVMKRGSGGRGWCAEPAVCVLSWLQVHQLDEQTQRELEVVPIDIANRDEVAPGVS